MKELRNRLGPDPAVTSKSGSPGDNPGLLLVRQHSAGPVSRPGRPGCGLTPFQPLVVSRTSEVFLLVSAVFRLRPRRDSNSRSRLRRAVLYPLSYGGLPCEQAAARTRAERQCTSVTIGLELAVAPGDIAVVLFSSRAGRLVERARCAGGLDHCPARTHQLCPAGDTYPSRAAEDAASVGCASGRHLLHHSGRAGDATTQQQQRELTRRRAPYHRG